MGVSMSHSRKRVAAATVMCAYCAIVNAQSTLLNFEELPNDYELQGVGDVVFTQGYTLHYTPAADEPYPVGFHSVGAQWPYNGRSTALLANSCSAVTTLTSQLNNPIRLMSIDLAALNGDDAVSVSFEAVTMDGDVVRHEAILDGRKTWQTVRLPPSFKRLQLVRWIQGDCMNNPPHMFDNIRVRSAEERNRSR